MSWHWLLFVAVIFIGNFLMIGAQVIALANTTGVLLCGARAILQGKSKPLLGITISIIFQSVAAITLSALIVSWIRYITDGEMKYLFAWIIGGVAAIYPIWQAKKLSNYERIHEPESYVAKGPTHIALSIVLLLTVVATIGFIIFPRILDGTFYWLLGAAAFVVIVSAVSIFITFRELKGEPSEINIDLDDQ